VGMQGCGLKSKIGSGGESGYARLWAELMERICKLVYAYVCACVYTCKYVCVSVVFIDIVHL